MKNNPSRAQTCRCLLPVAVALWPEELNKEESERILKMQEQPNIDVYKGIVAERMPWRYTIGLLRIHGTFEDFPAQAEFITFGRQH